MPVPTLEERICGGIVGSVVGDALGVPVEFKTREEVRALDVRGMTGPGTHGQLPGTWSDDSSLALATLEVLIQRGCVLREIMQAFSNWSNRGHMSARGQVFDIGVTTRYAICRYCESAPMSQWGGDREFDNGNGSLMRILPLSIFVSKLPDAEIIQRSGDVSALTHAHIRSRLCCAYFSLLIREVLQGAALQDAIAAASKILTPHVPPAEHAVLKSVLDGAVLHWDDDDIIGDGYVLHTLQASLWCCARAKSFEDAVLAAVNLGDDTDTTATVTGGLAGVIFGLNAIPEHWRVAIARSGDVHEWAYKLAKAVI